jgi:succinate-semialdehyde dehydrogenase/glutarate-semialdehyde dehydrogenase
MAERTAAGGSGPDLTRTHEGADVTTSISGYAVIDPATGEHWKSYPTCTDAEVDEAAADSDRAHQAWSRTTIAERAEVVRRIAALHMERCEELAELVVREMGKPMDQARGEITFSAMIYEYYADNAETFLADEPIEMPSWSTGRALVRQSSFGPLLGIMPWNFPFYQVARFAAPNLVAGNTVLLKHAPQCPSSAEALERLHVDAGAPAGVYRNVYATDEQAGRLIADPRVRGVSLTGSERAGRAVAAQAGQHLKKVVLELGGSDAFILLSTSDLGATIGAAASARLANSGQACNAAKRFIVLDEYYDDFVGGLVQAFGSVQPGRPMDPEVALGPLSSLHAAENLRDQVERAVAAGAELLVGGGLDGAYYSPTVLAGVTPDNPAWSEEFFGPVAVVHRVASEEEAIDLANATPFGLGSYVFTEDSEQALRVADRLEVGMVYVNGVQLESPELPFGGVKNSGFGRELGRYGIGEFVNRKLIRIVE